MIMPFPRNLPLEDVFASIADGLFTVDNEWNVTYFNESAQRITGIGIRDALGRKCWDVFNSSICDGHCALGECMKTGERIVNKAVLITRGDGSSLPISISAARLTNGDGEVVGGVETFRDLTEIPVEHLPEHVLPYVHGMGSSGLYGTMEEIKRRAARHALARNNGKRMATCRELNISKDTLRRMLARRQEDDKCTDPGCKRLGIRP